MGYGISGDIPKEKRELKNKLLKARYNLRQEGMEPVLRHYNLYVNNRSLTAREIESIISGIIPEKENESLEKVSSEDTVANQELEKTKKPVKGLSNVKPTALKNPLNPPAGGVLTRSTTGKTKYVATKKKNLKKDLSVINVIFWNSSGLNNIIDIKEIVNSRSIVCLSETWSISQPSIISPTNEYTQQVLYSPAERSEERGRAKGGIAVISNKNIYDSGTVYIA